MHGRHRLVSTSVSVALVLGVISAPGALAIRACASPLIADSRVSSLPALASEPESSADEILPPVFSTRDTPEEFSPLCGVGGGSYIPSRLFASPGKINMSRFTVKKENRVYEPGGNAWFIQKDTANHAGKAYKLKEPSGKRVHASIRANGDVVPDKYWYTPQ